VAGHSLGQEALVEHESLAAPIATTRR